MGLGLDRRVGVWLAAGGVVVCLWPGAAVAATISGSGHAEGVFIVQIVLLLLVGRLLGEVMDRLGQPAIMGQLMAGVLLGPSVFGALWTEGQRAIFPSVPEQKAMIDAVSQLGILLLLLLTGMETDLPLVRKVGRTSLVIAATGIVVPFACGFSLGQFLPASILPYHGQRLIPSLFLGTALSISSVKIVALVIREMNFMRRDLGQVIIASAIIEDTIGWVIIAITFGIANNGSLDWTALASSVVGVALFLGVSFTFGRGIVSNLIRLTNDHFRSEFAVITMILIIMGTMAEITQLLGVHTVLGAFVAGVLIGESPILTKHVEDQLRGLIAALFMPIFFGLAGLSANLTILNNLTLVELTGILILIASVGKFSGAFLGGKLGGLTFRQSLAIGSAMNARGSTEVIVATIGLSMGALTQNLFTMIVTMAVVTTLAMPPMLRRALSALPLGTDEKKRVERETLDERGFVSNLERMLLAVDNSAAGKFAAHLAGLVAGAQGMPLTIVHLDDEAPRTADDTSRQVKVGAEAGAAVTRNDATQPEPEEVQLTSKAGGRKPDAISEEARKGFDLLIVGTDGTHDSNGDIQPKVSQIAKGFPGPLAILTSRDGDDLPTLDRRLRILVPVNGSPASRRAAELAFAIARPLRAHVTALYVSSGDRPATGRSINFANEEAVLKDIAELGERYDVRVRTELQPRESADAAVLKWASNGYELIIIGVSQRPGEQLFFGNTARTLLRTWRGAMLLVAT
jgi:K+:H+ antiporter